MSCVGVLRRRRGEELIQLDSFGHGATFALGLALMRFFFTR